MAGSLFSHSNLENPLNEGNFYIYIIHKKEDEQTVSENLSIYVQCTMYITVKYIITHVARKETRKR